MTNSAKKLSKTTENDVNPLHSESLQDYREVPVIRPEHREPEFTRLLEQQAAKIPSHVFLMLSLMSMGASVVFEVTNRQRLSRFTSMWAPTLLIMGVYNKMVKTHGSK